MRRTEAAQSAFRLLANSPADFLHLRRRDRQGYRAPVRARKLGVDKEVRGHLLSHGRTRGVQGQHYER